MLTAAQPWLSYSPTTLHRPSHSLCAKNPSIPCLRNVQRVPVSATCRHSKIGGPILQDVKQVAARLAATFLFSTTVLWSTLLVADTAHALDNASVQRLFQRSCVGCHVGGGNILQPGATLTSSDLQRNGVSAVDDIYKITYSGKGRMPGFGEQCAPRGQCTFGPRLSDEEIRSLAEFVRLQADQGWLNLQ